MEAADIVRIARKRAGLTQYQLGLRSGVHRNVIGRWERGDAEPSLRTLRRVVKACELDLVMHLTVRDPTLDELAADQLELQPIARLYRLLPEDAVGPALEALDWMADAQTAVIAIGDVAGVLLGSPQRPEQAHVEIVSADPYSTETELRAAGFEPLDSEARWRDIDRRHPWRRSDGTVVAIASDLPGSSGFADLRDSMVTVNLTPSMAHWSPRDFTVAVAHPRDLLRLADASPREAARAQVPGLQAVLSRRSTADT